MNFTIPTASILALALFVTPMMAQEQTPETPPAVQEQAPADPAVEQAAPEAPAAVAEPPAVEAPIEAPAPVAQEVPAEVLEFLSDSRPMAELSDEELGGKAKRARKLSKIDGLPEDIRGQLAQISEAAGAEIANREQAAAAKAQEQPVAQEPKVEEKIVEEAPKAEQPAEPAVDVAAPKVPGPVAKLLSDARPATELSNDELKERIRKASRFAKSDELTADTTSVLLSLAKDAEAELAAREQQAGTPPPVAEKPVEKPAEAVVEQAPLPAVIEEAPKDPLPVAPAIVEVAPAPEPAPVVEAPAADKKQSQALDGNKGDATAEAKAQVFLDDQEPADKLSDEALRTRLDSIRGLMAGNELSRDTERKLRRKLKTEREVLRSRVAIAEDAATAKAIAEQAGKKQDANAPASKAERPSKIKKNDYNFNIQIVLNDRRPSDELQDYELRRRLQVYREATYDDQYENDQRQYWRAVMERDQYLLQQRLLRERRERQAEFQSDYDDEEGYDFEVDDTRLVDDGEYDDVYAAEVDDEELTKILVAPPRKKLKRKYTVKEVEASPELRQALPRIEIDTVKFGFNESFVRAEEVANLDRLADVMERILRKNPREVFLIEGHTDAVGSDAANLGLSRQRAIAIKKALTTYYVIPAKNLQTVGYGERYLKIPTAEAEQENRRASVSRATALIGQVEE